MLFDIRLQHSSMLLNRLSISYGFTDKALLWIQSSLSDRSILHISVLALPVLALPGFLSHTVSPKTLFLLLCYLSYIRVSQPVSRHTIVLAVCHGKLVCH